MSAASLRGIFLLLSLAFVGLNCTAKPHFQEVGLPPDLPRYLGQIEVLQVPDTVASLEWLPLNLRELEARNNANIRKFPFLASTNLARLGLRGAKHLTSLPPLPDSLVELDIRFTEIGGRWKCSDHLEVLYLGGENVVSLEQLRNTKLLELTLEGVPRLSSLAGLPDSLQYLSIVNSGRALSEVSKLPPNLRELRLENTQIVKVKDVPESLQSLTLIENSVLREMAAPRTLLSLTTDQRYSRPIEAQKVSAFPFLGRLDWLASTNLKSLPASLVNLRIKSEENLKDISSAPSLRHLQILQHYVRHPVSDLQGDQAEQGEAFSELSLGHLAGLEMLEWTGKEDLTTVPSGVNDLNIEWSSLKSLKDLPGSVKLNQLDISNTEIVLDSGVLGLENLHHLRCRLCSKRIVNYLPGTLQSLDLSGSRAVTGFPHGLPPQIKILNISDTGLSTLPDLPRSLEELNISGTNITLVRGGELAPLRHLRKLTVHAGQLCSLDGLPPTVKELRFLESKEGKLCDEQKY